MNVGAPRRQIHRSTWVVAALTTGVFLLANVPGERRWDPNSFVQHGWPAVYLHRRPHSFAPTKLSLWDVTSEVVEFRSGSVALNTAVAIIAILLLSAAFELWRRRRSRLAQLSLREGLIVILALCGLFAWIGWEWRQTRSEQRILEELRERDVQNRGLLQYWEQSGPDWLWELLRDDRQSPWFGSVVSVVLEEGEGDRSVRLLSQLPAIRELCCLRPANAITNLKPLVRTRRLRRLELFGCGLDDAALEPLGQCQSLESLDLSHNPITDKGLVELKNLRNLRELFLVNTQVTDQGIDDLREAIGEIDVWDD